MLEKKRIGAAVAIGVLVVAGVTVLLTRDVEIARWAWGSLFADFNNDGWEDLVVANGYITTRDTGDL